MDKVFILGTTKYSFMIHSFIEQERQYEIIGHSVNEKYLDDVEMVCKSRHVRVYALEELGRLFGNENVHIVNAIGYTDMNRIRQKTFEECLKYGYDLVNFISKRSIVLSPIDGKANIIFPGAYIGMDVEIGNNNVFYAGSVLTHDISVGNNNFIAANVTCGGEVQIGNNCFFGMGSTIRNRLCVKDYSLIGAASYLAHTTKEKEVVVPNRSVTLDKNSFEMSLVPKSEK